MAAKKKITGRIVGRAVLHILGVLLSVGLLAVCCFTLVLAQPQAEDRKVPADQPLLSPSPALNIAEESGLRELVSGFPVPVMSFMSGSGMQFVSASSADLAYKDGFARVATLYWQTEDGQPLILRSIYPASALSLLETNFHFAPVAGPALFGSASVRMESGDTVRIHTVTDTGLYAVNCPGSLSDRLSAIARSLQLFTVSEEN